MFPLIPKAYSHHPVFKYFFAIIVTFLAIALRWLLNPWLVDHLILVTLHAAVAIVVWHGGYRPALIVPVMGYLASYFLFINTSGDINFFSLENLIGLAAYLVSCTIIIVLGEMMRRARHSAQSNADTWEVTLSSIGDAVITADTKGLITYINPTAAALTHWKMADAKGKPLTEVFHIVNEQTRQIVENPAERVLREGIVVGLANHTILIAKDGTEWPIDDSAAPIFDKQQQLTGCVLVFRDISERRQTELALTQSESNLSDFFENATVGLHWVGADGRIERANQAELTMLGYTKEEYVGRHISEFHVNQSAIEGILTRLQKNETVRECPATLRHKDGSSIDVLINSNAYFRDGNFIHSRCFTVDITDRKRAEEIRAWMAAIVEASDDAIVSKTLNSIILSWNRGAERIFGYEATEVIGKPINLIIPPELQEEENTILSRIQAGERVDHFETIRITKDNRRIDVSLTISPVLNNDGEIIGASKVARDITEQKRAEDRLRISEQRFRLMADTAPVLIWISGTNKLRTWLNKQWLNFVGRTMEQELGKGWTDNIHPEDVDYCLNIYSAAFNAYQPFTIEYRIKHNSGQYHWIIDHGLPLYDAEHEFNGYIGSCIDITDRKSAEAALQQADRRKDEFLATLAHELRNPLAPIRNSLEILKHANGDGEILRQSQDTIERQLNHMVRLVDDLLDVSRITRDKIELRKSQVELSSLIHQAVETVNPLIEVNNHKIEIKLPDHPIFLNADPVRLSQVFSNLLNNACKFMQPNGHILITILQRGQIVSVTVSDSGAGISADEIDLIFDMFAQADTSLTRTLGGLGIGLTLAKRLVELHAGEIEVRSDGIGQGSEFTVHLPILNVEVEQKHYQSPPNQSFHKGLRILIVDDNRDGADSLATLLQFDNHETYLAYDGLEAIKAAEQFQPAIILLDIGLPKLNGYEVCRHIRKQQWGRRITIVALTGWGQKEDRLKSQDAGFDDLLVKPVAYDKLCELLESWVLVKTRQLEEG